MRWRRFLDGFLRTGITVIVVISNRFQRDNFYLSSNSAGSHSVTAINHHFMKTKFCILKAVLGLTILFIGCRKTTTKEVAIAHFHEVYSIYHDDYQTTMQWFNPLMQIITDINSGQIPDSNALTAIQEQVTVGQQFHKNSLDRLSKVKPIECKNDILEKAKENIHGQIIAQNDVNSIIELLRGGIQDNEREELKIKAKILLTNANDIEIWKDDLKAFRKEFEFTREDTKAIIDRYSLDKNNQ